MTGFTFDATAALQRAQKCRDHPTPPTPPTDRQVESGKVGSVGGVGRMRASDPEMTSAPYLPKHPPTCAFCGVSDWHVAMILADGRNAHVGCAPSTSIWTNSITTTKGT